LDKRVIRGELLEGMRDPLKFRETSIDRNQLDPHVC